MSMWSYGKEIENFVCAYLIEHGLQLITANYRCKVGEIDLIMREKKTLVFVEVRYRLNTNYGDSIATVNKHKQLCLTRAAIYYLQRYKLYNKIACRFDIVGVSGFANYNVCWVRDAFWAKW